MFILYQKNNLLLRRAYLPDALRLARVLRWKDKAELTASHPGKEPEYLLKHFITQSSSSFILEYCGKPVALFGLAPDVWMGRRACVWLLTGRELGRISKTFVRLARRFLAAALAQYDELYNFADGRYEEALRFIRRLGGRFDGVSFDTPSARFLRFTFRRK